MRVCVIGAGSIGTRHILNLLALGCHVYVQETDARRRLEIKSACPEARVFGLLGGDESFDAMVVSTPYDLHLHYAEYAIGHGIPVFVEKPLGSVSQLSAWRRVAAAYEGLALPSITGYQCRFHSTAKAMRLLAPAESGFFATACDMRTWPGKSYGPLALEASHDLDLALSMGAPATVTEAIIDPHYVAIQLGPHWRVTIEDRADYRREWTVDQRGASMSVTFDRPEALGDQMYRDEMAHFLDCVQSGRQTECPLSDGVRVLEVLSQAEQLCRESLERIEHGAEKQTIAFRT